MVATLTFLWAWYHQYKSNVILASLRKNKKGTSFPWHKSFIPMIIGFIYR